MAKIYKEISHSEGWVVEHPSGESFEKAIFFGEDAEKNARMWADILYGELDFSNCEPIKII